MKALHKRLAQEPDSSTTTASVLNVLSFLTELYDTSIIFQEYIVEAMNLGFQEHTTEHECVEGGGEESQHQCKCKVLDNIMKVLLSFTHYPHIGDFIARLAKTCPSFAMAFVVSYWQNYSYIFVQASDPSIELDFKNKIICQVAMNEQDIARALAAHVHRFTTVFGRLMTQFNQPNKSQLVHALDCVHDDYTDFINKEGVLSRTFLTDSNLLPLIGEGCIQMQFINNLTQLSQAAEYDDQGLNPYLTTALNSLLKVFMHTMRGYDFQDPKLNSRIFSTFFNFLQREAKTDLAPDHSNSPHVPLYNSLAILLGRFIYTTNLPLDRLPSTLELVTGLPGTELQSIMQCVERRLVRVLGFMGEVSAKRWIYYGEKALAVVDTLRHNSSCRTYDWDLALLQLLLFLFPPPSLDLVGMFCETSHIPLCTDSAKTFREQKQLLEESVFQATSLLLNDLSFRILLLKPSLPGYSRDTPSELLPDLEVVIRKDIAAMIIGSFEEKDYLGTLKTRDIVLKLDRHCQTTEANSIVEAYLDKQVSSDGQVGFVLRKDLVQGANPFNLRCVSDFSRYEIALTVLLPKFKISGLPLLDFSHNSKADTVPKCNLLLKLPESAMATLLQLAANVESPIIHACALRTFTPWLHLNIALCSTIKPQLVSLYERWTTQFPAYYQPLVLAGLKLLHANDLTSAPAGALTVTATAITHADDKASIKSRQLEAREKFAKLRAQFSSKHAEDLKHIESKAAFQPCSVCHEDCSHDTFSVRPYGYLCVIARNTVLSLAPDNSLQSSHEDQKATLPKASKTRPHFQLHGCLHAIHIKCAESRTTSKNVCPLCTRTSHILLPAIPLMGTVDSANADLVCSAIMQVTSYPKTPSTLTPITPMKIWQRFTQTLEGTLQTLDMVPSSNYFSRQATILAHYWAGVCSIIQSRFKDSIPEYDARQQKQFANPFSIKVLPTVAGCLMLTRLKSQPTTPELLSTIVSTTVMAFILQLALKYALETGTKAATEIIKILGQSLANRQADAYLELQSILLKLLGLIAVWKPIGEDANKYVVAAQTMNISQKVGTLFALLKLPDPMAKAIELMKSDAEFECGTSKKRVSQWLQEVLARLSLRLLTHLNPRVEFKLIDLPPNYDQLLRRYAGTPCVECRERKSNKRLCLLCGSTYCFNHDPGSHTSKCVYSIRLTLALSKGILEIASNARIYQNCIYYNSIRESISSYFKLRGTTLSLLFSVVLPLLQIILASGREAQDGVLVAESEYACGKSCRYSR